MQCMMYYARKEDGVHKVIMTLVDVRALCCVRCGPQSAIVLVLERHEKGWCLWGENPRNNLWRVYDAYDDTMTITKKPHGAYYCFVQSLYANGPVLFTICAA